MLEATVKKRRMLVPGHRLVVGMVAIALAVMFVGLGATGASANQAETCPTVPGGTAGQKQGGTANPASGAEANVVIVDEKGQPVPAGEAQFCIATENGGGAGAGTAQQPGVATAQGSGVTCTITLPEGAAPGSTIVVTLPDSAGAPANTGAQGSPCAISVISAALTADPSAPTNAATTGVAGEACFIALPADAQGAPAAPNATAEAGGTTKASDGQPIVIEATEPGQPCGVGVTTTAQGTGGTTTGNDAAPADAMQTCSIATQGGSTAGTAASGATTGGTATEKTPDGTFIVNGQAVACTSPEPGTVPPAEAGRTTTDATTTAGTGQSFTCVVADSGNPGTLTCTAQP
jgi:hypothetical protein